MGPVTFSAVGNELGPLSNPESRIHLTAHVTAFGSDGSHLIFTLIGTFVTTNGVVTVQFLLPKAIHSFMTKMAAIEA